MQEHACSDAYTVCRANMCNANWAQQLILLYRCTHDDEFIQDYSLQGKGNTGCGYKGNTLDRVSKYKWHKM